MPSGRAAARSLPPFTLHSHAVKAWRKVLSRGWRQFLNSWLALEPAFQSEQMARLLLKSFWIHFQKAMLGLQTGQGRAAFRPSAAMLRVGGTRAVALLIIVSYT